MTKLNEFKHQMTISKIRKHVHCLRTYCATALSKGDKVKIINKHTTKKRDKIESWSESARARARVCVCVCVCVRERERESVCVSAVSYTHLTLPTNAEV